MFLPALGDQGHTAPLELKKVRLCPPGEGSVQPDAALEKELEPWSPPAQTTVSSSLLLAPWHTLGKGWVLASPGTSLPT